MLSSKYLNFIIYIYNRYLLGGDAEFETSGRDESDTGYRSVTLPHVEEISGNKGTIIHWDIQKNETTNLENFEIDGEGKTADLDVLSLTGKSNRNGGSCVIESSPGKAYKTFPQKIFKNFRQYPTQRIILFHFSNA